MPRYVPGDGAVPLLEMETVTPRLERAWSTSTVRVERDATGQLGAVMGPQADRNARADPSHVAHRRVVKEQLVGRRSLARCQPDRRSRRGSSVDRDGRLIGCELGAEPRAKGCTIACTERRKRIRPQIEDTVELWCARRASWVGWSTSPPSTALTTRSTRSPAACSPRCWISPSARRLATGSAAPTQEGSPSVPTSSGPVINPPAPQGRRVVG